MSGVPPVQKGDSGVAEGSRILKVPLSLVEGVPEVTHPHGSVQT